MEVEVGLSYRELVWYRRITYKEEKEWDVKQLKIEKNGKGLMLKFNVAQPWQQRFVA